MMLLVDGNNLAMRSVHAMARSQMSADGVATGPLVAFVNSLSAIVRETQPDHLVVCWDSPVSGQRRLLLPSYKGTRGQVSPEVDDAKRTSFSLMKEFLALSDVLQCERLGFEADDLISWLVYHRERVHPGTRVTILSSDKDFLQVVSDDVEQIRLSSGGADTDRWTVERVREEYGCPEPGHLALAMALAGDVSDNVPGVPGVGMKTALKYLAKANWDLDQVDHPKVVEYREQVRLALSLVDLRQPAAGLSMAIPGAFRPTAPDGVLFQALIGFLDRYRLQSIRSRVVSNTLWRSA